MKNVIKKYKHLILLSVILIFSLFIRTFWLEKSPPALNWDETAHGYNAYSISKTGKDEFGKTLPLSLRSFDDYKPAIYAYTVAPFVSLFGLNEYAVRLPSAISGAIIVLLIYLLTKTLANRKTALIASLLVCIEPWSIHFSRAAFEANLALMFLLVGIFFIIQSKFKNWLSLIGLFFLGISMYTYHSEKILFVPLVLGFAYLYRQNIIKTKRNITVFALLLLLLVSPLIYQTVTNTNSIGRFTSTTIFKNSGNSKINILDTSLSIAQRYLSYYSPINLFVRGTPEPAQRIPGFGMFYNIEFIFWLVGIFAVVTNIKKYKEIFLLLLVLPLPAIITWNWFYPSRVLPLFAVFAIIIAIGVSKFIDKLSAVNRKVRLLLIIGLLCFFVNNFFNLATSLLFYMPYKEAGNWQSGMKEIVSEITKKENSYKEVVFETKTAQPYVFVLFWTKYPPEQYQTEIKNKYWINGLRKEFNFGKYTFRDIYWDKDKDLRNILLVGPESSLPIEKVKLNPNVDYIFDIKGPFGETLSRMVGIK